ncbi:MAG: DUF1453 family protein [Firmicutes bacterium]|nr:DUF1453 family protein [Bacillota bacterium]
MNTSTQALALIIAVSLVGWVMIRQQRRRPFRPGSAWVMPVIVVLLTVQAVRPEIATLSIMGWSFWGLSVLAGWLIAWIRVQLTTLEHDGRQLYVQGTPWGTLVWAALLIVKVGFRLAAAHATGQLASALTSNGLVMAAASTVSRRVMLAVAYSRGRQHSV